MESAVDISLDRFPSFSGAAQPRRSIRISSQARRAVVVLLMWAAACLLLGGITLHHDHAATQADTGLCKRH